MKLTETVTVRLSREERDMVQQLAIDNYESVSEYARRLFLMDAAKRRKEGKAA